MLEIIMQNDNLQKVKKINLLRDMSQKFDDPEDYRKNLDKYKQTLDNAESD